MLMEILESRVLLSAGSLVRSFGSGGILATPTTDTTQLITVQTNGEFIVAGSTTSSGTTAGFLERYRANGSVDTSFGTGGRVILTASDLADVVDLTQAPGGKLVIIGTDGNGDDGLARLNSNGTLDTTFGTAGVAALPAGAVSPVAKIEKNQTVIVSADYTLASGASPVGILLQYSRKGVQVTSGFGVNGIVINDAGAGFEAGDFFIFKKGQIEQLYYGTGTVTDQTTGQQSQVQITELELFNANGTLDLDFNQNQGPNISATADNRYLPDGAILSVESSAGGSTTTSQYFINGTLDTNFAKKGGGKLSLPFPANAGTSTDISVVEPSNKYLIVESGTTAATTPAPYVAFGGVTRVGKVDHVFGKTGVREITPAQTIIAAAGDGSHVLLLESSTGSTSANEILAYTD
jgi:uncharacterized delta-60 repeat protein